MLEPAGGDLESQTLGAARKLIWLVLGATVLVMVAAALALPGPDLLFVAAGVAVLAAEWVWARRLQERLRNEVRSALATGGASRP